METKLILISGKQGSGKTTLQHLLAQKLGREAVTLNFADVIYEIHNFALETLSDYDVKVPKKDGKLLQLLGTEWGRKTLGENIWCAIVRNRLDLIEPEFAVIGDCRFENEFNYFPEALRVRLQAPTEVRKARCDAWRDTDQHPSEIDLDKYAADGRFDLTLPTDIMSPEECCEKVTKTLITNWFEKRNN